MEREFGRDFERVLLGAQRLKWALQFDRAGPKDWIEAEEGRFLDFVQKRLFQGVPKDLKDTREQFVRLAESLDKSLAGEQERKTRHPLPSIIRYTPGSAPIAEIVEDIDLWCRKTAGVLKKTVYSNPKFNAVSTEVIAEAVEYYVLTQLQDVSNASKFYGFGFFILMPDVMCAVPKEKVNRDHQHVLNHMCLLKDAALRSLSKMEEIHPDWREQFNEVLVPLQLDPRVTVRRADNLVSFTKQLEFKPLMEALFAGVSSEGMFSRSYSEYVYDVLSCLVNVDSPDYRRGLTLEVLRNLKFGKKNMALEILKEKSTFDETTRRLLNYNPYALEEDEKFSLKVDYPGVGDLDEDRRKILLEKAVEMAYTTGHNDLMVDPLIKILNTHTNPAEELSELATTYLWFITRTKDQCPKALEGLEGESREVKSEYLIVLAKFPAPGAEADFIKKRLKDAETEKRKLEILKEEDQRASKPIDDMLK